MRRVTKIMLGLTIANAVAPALVLSGIVNVSEVTGFYVVFPLVAIFYGIFLICRIMQKEVAKFDAEERKHHKLAARDNCSQSAESHGHEHHEPMRA